jgi:hypothetical protein
MASWPTMVTRRSESSMDFGAKLRDMMPSINSCRLSTFPEEWP